MPLDDEEKTIDPDEEMKDYSSLRKFANQRAALNFLAEVTSNKWMMRRGLGINMTKAKAQRKFVKDIFEAIDLDGSGTMDQEELIKALLCMGLSQDI